MCGAVDLNETFEKDRYRNRIKMKHRIQIKMKPEKKYIDMRFEIKIMIKEIINSQAEIKKKNQIKSSRNNYNQIRDRL